MAEQFLGRVQVQTEDDGLTTITLNGNTANVVSGGNGRVGAVVIQDDAGTERVKLLPKTITVYDESGQIVIQLDAGNGNVQFGANGARGQVTVHDGQGVPTILIGGADARIELGADGEDGDIYLKNSQGVETIHLGGEDARIELGADGEGGSFHINNNEGQRTIRLDGQTANVFLGGENSDGDIWLFPDSGDPSNLNTATIHLGGNTGDIILQNADVAEDFDVCDSATLEPGTVVVIGDDAKLQASTQSYDRRVAGVVAGTGSPRPGIILGRYASSQSRLPVALIGRVNCLVDASTSPIMVGDLLTTSTRPGHAMKADDPVGTPGAVIGKSLQCQLEGTGMIQILVALQ